MIDIEQLTDYERNMLDDISPTFGAKALRIIAAQARRIAELEAEACEPHWAPIVSDGSRCRYCVQYGRTCAYHNGSMNR